jgi:hypothetical protein
MMYGVILYVEGSIYGLVTVVTVIGHLATQQDNQCKCNVTLRRVRITVVAMEKQ